MKKCVECGEDFTPDNNKGKFCSPSCRQKDYRKRINEMLKIARGEASKKELLSGLTPKAKKEVKVTNLTALRPQSNFTINTADKLGEYQIELLALSNLPETTLTKRRKQFLNTQIDKLKKPLK